MPATTRTRPPTDAAVTRAGQGVAYDGWEGRGSNAPPESQYVPAGDIVSFDIYPYNNCGGDANVKVTCGQFWLNAFGVDRLRQWSNRGQAVWTDLETTIIAAGTTSGPTPVQVRSEVWLSLIHGANGVTYFVHSWEPTFRADGIFGNSTMVTGGDGAESGREVAGERAWQQRERGGQWRCSELQQRCADWMCNGQGEGAGAVCVRGDRARAPGRRPVRSRSRG